MRIPHSSGRAWLAVATASLASFLVLLDDSAVALALSELGQELGLGLLGLEWVVNIYTLALAVLTLPGGLLADRLGARRVLLAGLLGFGAVSLAAGLVASGGALLALRAAQGASAALVAPAALAAVTSAFPAARRGVALGVWAGVSAAALAAGPLVGALLTQGLGWRSIFLVNVPLSGLLVVGALTALPRSPRRRLRGRLDPAGAASSGLALSALVLGLTQASTFGWASLRLWAILAVAAGAFVVFLRVERRAAAPLVDLSLFRLPNFLVANLLSLLNLAIMCSLFFFLALYLQRGMLLPPVSAGVALLPFTGLVAAVAPLGGRLTDGLGPRLPITLGMLLVGAGLALLAPLGPGWTAADLVPGLATAGVGLGLASTPVTTAALALVPEPSAGIAAATVNVSRLIGLASGVAAMGAIVAVGWPGGAVSTAVDRAAFADALGNGFAVNAALALLAAVTAAAAIRNVPAAPAGEAVPGQTRG